MQTAFTLNLNYTLDPYSSKSLNPQIGTEDVVGF